MVFFATTDLLTGGCAVAAFESAAPVSIAGGDTEANDDDEDNALGDGDPECDAIDDQGASMSMAAAWSKWHSSSGEK